MTNYLEPIEGHKINLNFKEVFKQFDPILQEICTEQGVCSCIFRCGRIEKKRKTKDDFHSPEIKIIVAELEIKKQKD